LRFSRGNGFEIANRWVRFWVEQCIQIASAGI
jgi:hypothetical protein